MYSKTFAGLIATTHLSAGLFCLFVCPGSGFLGLRLRATGLKTLKP